MTKITGKNEAPISLHGLGFIQVPLGAEQRLHVWHPDLPRRRCFKDSAIHDHRFGFTSKLLRGSMSNVIYGVHSLAIYGMITKPTHHSYNHNGDRLPTGNRPWNRDDSHLVVPISSTRYTAGHQYEMLPYVFHATIPEGDGRVATLMTKTVEHDWRSAHSLCAIGVEPEVDFDRFQVPDNKLWEYVREVLSWQKK